MKKLFAALLACALLFAAACDTPTPTPKPTATATQTATQTATPTQLLTNAPSATQASTATPVITASATATLKPTAKPTKKPTPKPTPKTTAKPSPRPTVKPTAKPTAAPTQQQYDISQIFSIYENAMEEYSDRNYFDFFSKKEMVFTVGNQTSPIYNKEQTSKGRDTDGSARHYMHYFEESFGVDGDGNLSWYQYNQEMFNTASHLYVNMSYLWPTYPDYNDGFNQYCPIENELGAIDYLNSTAFTTFMTETDITGVTGYTSGANKVYTFTLKSAKAKALVEEALQIEPNSMSFTVNSLNVKITVDAQNNVIRDEINANVSITLYGDAGTLTISDYTQYLSQSAPAIDTPDWTDESELVDTIFSF